MPKNDYNKKRIFPKLVAILQLQGQGLTVKVAVRVAEQIIFSVFTKDHWAEDEDEDVQYLPTWCICSDGFLTRTNFS